MSECAIFMIVAQSTTNALIFFFRSNVSVDSCVCILCNAFFFVRPREKKKKMKSLKKINAKTIKRVTLKRIVLHRLYKVESLSNCAFFCQSIKRENCKFTSSASLFAYVGLLLLDKKKEQKKLNSLECWNVKKAINFESLKKQNNLRN